MSSLFGITAADIQAKLAPVNEDEVFAIGAGRDLEEAACLEIVEEWEDIVLGRLRDRYRQLCRRVDGEILIRQAVGGETSATVALRPITAGTLKLWKNFPSSRMWEARDGSLAMAEADYCYNATTGVITLVSALVAGDTLWGEYDHGAASQLKGLRDIIKTLVAIEISRRFDFFREGDRPAFWGEWEASAYANLNRTQAIDLFDRIELVSGETTAQGFYRRVLLHSTQPGG